jgi:hypothetical protein
MITTASKRAAHGARMLDLARPGWHRQIDLTTLDLSVVDGCVLGQLYSHYNLGRAMLGISPSRAVEYGFFVRTRLRSYKALTRAWRREICTRLADDPKFRGPSVTHSWVDEIADFEPAREREPELV